MSVHQHQEVTSGAFFGSENFTEFYWRLSTMLDRETKEMFSEHIGETFRITLESADAINLELIEVSALPERTFQPKKWGRASEIKIRPDPFSMVFRGPKDFFLEQRMYTLEHEVMGTLEGLFLVPIDEDERGFYYEVIFN